MAETRFHHHLSIDIFYANPDNHIEDIIRPVAFYKLFHKNKPKFCSTQKNHYELINTIPVGAFPMDLSTNKYNCIPDTLDL